MVELVFIVYCEERGVETEYLTSKLLVPFESLLGSVELLLLLILTVFDPAKRLLVGIKAGVSGSGMNAGSVSGQGS